jgi:hypothetical protein
MKKTTALLAAAAATSAIALGAAGVSSQAATTHAKPAKPDATFKMVRSTGAVNAGCLPYAKAKVTITKLEGAEKMKVYASGLFPRSEYDLFVIQVPDAPFGMSWYQGDLESDRYGNATGTFIGRFNEETFSVAPGTAPAPVVHDSPIRDADSNPTTAPLHQYHLGLWFNSPRRSDRAGCGNAVTPFNGEHNAGPQVLSTRQFPIDAGPLSRIAS